MKQKLFSWGDDFVIKDESERDEFFVDGKAFSLGNQLSFQDMAGNELAFIRQKLLRQGVFHRGAVYLLIAVPQVAGEEAISGVRPNGGTGKHA